MTAYKGTDVWKKLVIINQKAVRQSQRGIKIREKNTDLRRAKVKVTGKHLAETDAECD